VKVRIALSPRTPEPTRTWDAAQALGRAVMARNPGVERCVVEVHANRRELLKWRIGPTAQLSVHWALVPETDGLMAVLSGDRSAWERLLEGMPAAPLPRLNPRGRVHDLIPLLHAQHQHLLANIDRTSPAWMRRSVSQPVDVSGSSGDERWDPPEVAVTWGRFAGRAPRRALRLGSCEQGEPPIVRVHPVLDHVTVPEWFVGFVLYHELLHVVYPPVRIGARRLVHSAELHRAEQAHPDHDRALAWEQANLMALLARYSER
jgi:hypothetical protein